MSQTSAHIRRRNSVPRPRTAARGGRAAPVPAAPLETDDYFTEERMLQELSGQPLAAPSDCVLMAYRSPGWHACPMMERWLGAGWTEYALLERSQPLFRGHVTPKYPLWGPFDTADPAWAAREIDLAADHGIAGWMFAWYWYEGTTIYRRQLEEAFLKAPNRSRLKFAVMWANFDWKNVYPARSWNAASTLLPQRYSEADTLKLIDYCVEHYFGEANYWRIDGRPVFAIADFSTFVSSLGVEVARRTLERARDRVRRAGLGELHIQSSQAHGDLGALATSGVDSATSYHPFAWTYMRDAGRTHYAAGAMDTIRTWRSAQAECSVPYFPGCPVGWDDSARFGTSAHVAFGRSPDQYERLCRAARSFVGQTTPRIVFLSSWNEWTEDHVLLPDTVFGYSYLDAVKRAFRE